VAEAERPLTTKLLAKCSSISGSARDTIVSTRLGLEVRNWREWLPGNALLQLSLSKFLNVYGGPGWIRTRSGMSNNLVRFQELHCQPNRLEDRKFAVVDA
jgi:hypothetical protein